MALIADRWHTCFCDLSVDQGLLGKVEGRTADDAAYWLVGATPAWRDAVKTVGDVRRRAVRELYGRRGRSGDPEYGLKHLLEKKLENLSPEQFAKVIDTLDATGPGQDTAMAWIGKEKLRRALTSAPASPTGTCRARACASGVPTTSTAETAGSSSQKIVRVDGLQAERLEFGCGKVLWCSR